MQPKILFLNSVIGVLGVITCVQAVPIEVIYAGDTCECPKKIDYEMNMPLPVMPQPNIPSEYDYRVEHPLKAKARVMYSFDFDVEQPAPKLPIQDPKLDIYAKIDRVMAPKKDCYAAQESPRSCGCNQYPSDTRYVLPENSAARITRNLRHPNSLDSTEEPAANQMTPAPKMVAIFFKPVQQTMGRDVSQTRHKRDISRIFMRPKKNQKRSDRVSKQYNKSLKDISAGERVFFEETKRSPRARSRETAATPNGSRPLQQLSSILKLPRLRNKRDIKGEYDLIEKDREQMDLTLPEIIQYMPETLDPNFKRNQCNFGQRCRHAQFAETSTKTMMTTTVTKKTTTAPSETATTTMLKTETGEITTPQGLSSAQANCLQNEVKEEKQTDNDCSSTHKRRKARNNYEGGCPMVINAFNPTPTTGYTYESLDKFQAQPRSFNAASYDYGRDPVPQQFVGVPHNPYAPSPIMRAAIPQYSSDQLDRIIAAVVNKHSDFLEASTQRDKPLVSPPQEQKEQTIHFLKSLLHDWGDWSWFGGNQQQQPQHMLHLQPQQPPIVHSPLRLSHEPDATYERPPSL